MDFPAGAPDIPDAAPSETLFSMHQGLTHHVGTNRILLNLVQLATKLGFGTSAPGSGPGVLRRTASGISAWERARAGDVQGDGVANQVLRTGDGNTCAFATMSGSDFGVNTIPLNRLAGLAVGNVVKADGTGNIQGQVQNTDILAGTILSGNLAGNAVTQRASSVGNFIGTAPAGAYVDVNTASGKITLATTGGDILVWFFGYAINTTQPAVQAVALRLDSGAEVNSVSVYSYAGLATYPVPFCTAALFTGVSGTVAAPVTHTVFARHQANSGSMTTTGTMIGMEVKK